MHTKQLKYVYSQLTKTNHSCTVRTAAELHRQRTMEHKIINLNVLVLSLSNIFEMLCCSIYISTINADETRLNMLIASMGGLFQLLHASLPPSAKIAGKISCRTRI